MSAFAPLFSVSLRDLIASLGALVAGGFAGLHAPVMPKPVRSYQLCCGGVLRDSSTIRCYGRGNPVHGRLSVFGLNPGIRLNDFHNC